MDNCNSKKYYFLIGLADRILRLLHSLTVQYICTYKLMAVINVQCTIISINYRYECTKFIQRIKL